MIRGLLVFFFHPASANKSEFLEVLFTYILEKLDSIVINFCQFHKD